MIKMGVFYRFLRGPRPTYGHDQCKEFSDGSIIVGAAVHQQERVGDDDHAFLYVGLPHRFE